MNSSLDVVMIDALGEPELGKGKGAVLDMLTNVWHECFISLTVGRRQKTPFIHHDMQKREWEAIARILVYGFQKYGYFPLQLSTLFLLSCLFGEESITPEFLLASFKDYMPAEDQEVLDECLIFDHRLHFSTTACINLDYSLHFSHGVYSSQPSHANLDTLLSSLACHTFDPSESCRLPSDNVLRMATCLAMQEVRNTIYTAFSLPLVSVFV